MSANVSECNDPLGGDRGEPRSFVEELPKDFALVQLDTRFRTLLSEIRALQLENNRAIGNSGQPLLGNISSDEPTSTRTIESVLRRLDPIEREIMATPAHTIVGLGIKAWHAANVVSEHWDSPIEQIDWDARAVRLLIEAVCKVAGIGLPFPNNADL
ncbi:hypothetical protein HL666_14495 [Bradyrhizobium sp. 83002]|uniref:hypothetical protein n=1 Tax=Bradyrhizobium aeschynomenes TaxID=2734909 RepID=UPI0015560A13|nr:hypothetical protein [Bradyrhizobium aeschynomenes]NPU11979.1 hypothetical protein [Bradyrhizobium aeschynomenes]